MIFSIIFLIIVFCLLSFVKGDYVCETTSRVIINNVTSSTKLVRNDIGGSVTSFGLGIANFWNGAAILNPQNSSFSWRNYLGNGKFLDFRKSTHLRVQFQAPRLASFSVFAHDSRDCNTESSTAMSNYNFYSQTNDVQVMHVFRAFQIHCYRHFKGRSCYLF
jgi:hypothetical protein